MKLRTCLFVLSGAMLLTATEVRAQQNRKTKPEGQANTFTPSPSHWYVERQANTYDDPKAIARSRAAFRAQQRQFRISARKWFGYSNARPQASGTPWMGSYSPGWSGSSARPYVWYGNGYW